MVVFFPHRLCHSPWPVSGFLLALQVLAPPPGSGAGDDTFCRSAGEMNKSMQDRNVLWDGGGGNLCDFETYLSFKYWFQTNR